MAQLTRQQLRAVRELLALLMHERPSLAPGPRPRTNALPLDFIRAHLLAPQAYRAGYDIFERDYIDSRLYLRMHRECLAEVSTRFADEGVQSVLVYGSASAQALYDDSALRPLSRIDLLLRQDELPAGRRLLGGLGYVVAAEPHGRNDSAILRRGSAESEACIALHTHLSQPIGGRIDLTGAWRRARPVDTQHAAILKFQPIDLFLAHIAHAGHHHLRVPAVCWTDAARLGRAHSSGKAVSDLRGEARAARLGPARSLTLAMTRVLAERGARLPRRSPAAAVMPAVPEIFNQQQVAAPLGRLREAAMLQGPRDLASLAVGRVTGRSNKS